MKIFSLMNMIKINDRVMLYYIQDTCRHVKHVKCTWILIDIITIKRF